MYYAVGSCLSLSKGRVPRTHEASKYNRNTDYVCIRCLTAYHGHHMYCKYSPLDWWHALSSSREPGINLARETIPVYFPRRVWGLDYRIVYSYLGICHVFVMRFSWSLTIILSGHTAVQYLIAVHSVSTLPSSCTVPFFWFQFRRTVWFRAIGATVRCVTA